MALVVKRVLRDKPSAAVDLSKQLSLLNQVNIFFAKLTYLEYFSVLQHLSWVMYSINNNKTVL